MNCIVESVGFFVTFNKAVLCLMVRLSRRRMWHPVMKVIQETKLDVVFMCDKKVAEINIRKFILWGIILLSCSVTLVTSCLFCWCCYYFWRMSLLISAMHRVRLEWMLFWIELAFLSISKTCTSINWWNRIVLPSSCPLLPQASVWLCTPIHNSLFE